MEQRFDAALTGPVSPGSPTARADATTFARQRRAIVAASLGNALELFDFTVFSFFAGLIGKLFFPVEGEYGPLLLALATFGIGFVMRPVGSVVIGNYADRAGRKPALTLTIGLMALGTAIIGLAPTYAQIGIAAPLLVVTGRLLQGFSAGGEIGAATSFLMESGTRSNRGFMVSWQMAGQGASALAGALCGALLIHGLPQAALESWGWRVPFLLGLLIGPVGFYIRRHLDETHQDVARERSALSEAVQQHSRKLLLGTLLILGGTAEMYVVVFFTPAWLVKTFHMPAATSLLTGCAAGAIMLLVSPLAGVLADRLGRRKPLLLTLRMVSLLGILPGFLLVQNAPSLGSALVLVCGVMMLATLGAPAGFLFIMEAFPRRVRATGLAIIYACGVTLFGGFAQFIVTWMLSVTGNPLSPAWYVLGCGTASLLALLAFAEQRVAD
ncbi:MFS transporter [Cupriavidus pinatubonensis]|uniref:Proline/betaine transporter n=1 Tax=Cupriavidus pinatubonensis TaxID=248026 RepID=A0ABN7Z4U9_9BURK|nr:MFS transporter [Cupriavidus pinatubonensis]CAG9179766.1 Proline/betaine transporter [Cupriavidus pinatubonensis]